MRMLTVRAESNLYWDITEKIVPICNRLTVLGVSACSRFTMYLSASLSLALLRTPSQQQICREENCTRISNKAVWFRWRLFPIQATWCFSAYRLIDFTHRLAGVLFSDHAICFSWCLLHVSSSMCGRQGNSSSSPLFKLLECGGYSSPEWQTYSSLYLRQTDGLTVGILNSTQPVPAWRFCRRLLDVRLQCHPLFLLGLRLRLSLLSHMLRSFQSFIQKLSG